MTRTHITNGSGDGSTPMCHAKSGFVMHMMLDFIDSDDACGNCLSLLRSEAFRHGAHITVRAVDAKRQKK